MPTVRQLKEEISTTESIKLITQALGDIATSQIKATRRSVEQNIKFFEEISHVYQIVKGMASKTKLYQQLMAAKNGKTVRILLTSDYKFYGGLDSEVSRFFLLESAKYQADQIIVGTSGQDIVSHALEAKTFQRINFKEDFPSLAEMRSLSEQIFDYSKILVYHSKFVTLLNQIPVVTDISALSADEKADSQPIQYILEPEIDKMIAFFETQMIILLMQAIFLDADIARKAARMVAMNQAEEEADKILVKEKKQLLRGRRDKQNRRILETYAGVQGGERSNLTN